MRLFLAGLAAIFTASLLLYFSPVGAQISFHILSEFYPAISGETNNTSTRHGLSAEIYNLGFLTFAVVSGVFVGVSGFSPSASRRLVSAGILTAILSMASAAMFWPGEQLINIRALALLTIVQIVLTCIVLKLAWTALPRSLSISVLGSLIIMVIAYQGLFLPLAHTLATVLHAHSYYQLLDYLGPAAHVITPVMAVVLAVFHYRKVSRRLNIDSIAGNLGATPAC